MLQRDPQNVRIEIENVRKDFYQIKTGQSWITKYYQKVKWRAATWGMAILT